MGFAKLICYDKQLNFEMEKHYYKSAIEILLIDYKARMIFE